jgi:hypothetical protein
MATLIKWPSLQKSVSKFMPKKFYEIDTGKRRQNGLTSLSHPRINIIRSFGYATYFIKHFIHFLCFYIFFIETVLALLHIHYDCSYSHLWFLCLSYLRCIHISHRSIIHIFPRFICAHAWHISMLYIRQVRTNVKFENMFILVIFWCFTCVHT